MENGGGSVKRGGRASLSQHRGVGAGETWRGVVGIPEKERYAKRDQGGIIKEEKHALLVERNWGKKRGEWWYTQEENAGCKRPIVTRLGWNEDPIPLDVTRTWGEIEWAVTPPKVTRSQSRPTLKKGEGKKSGICRAEPAIKSALLR